MREASRRHRPPAGDHGAAARPGRGCPWDKEQTFATIAPYTIEEAYEVADAIERGDLAELKDELGDLLLQVVFHARMAEETGAFDFADVARAINDKMVRRHPHVFEDETLCDAAEQTEGWEAASRPASARGRPRGRGLLDDVPVGLPALTRAVKLTKRAARVGFDLAVDPGGVRQAARGGRPSWRPRSTPATWTRPARRLGDVLFVVANLARTLDVEPEDALRATNAKFVRRFGYIEAAPGRARPTPDQSDLAEMDGLWDEAKAAEKA